MKVSIVDSGDRSGFPPRGTVVALKAQLLTPSGKYKVLSSRGDDITLRKGGNTPVVLSREQFRKLQEMPADFGIDEGVLSALGYRVGRDRLPVNERRRLLEAIVSRPFEELPKATGVEDWGEPGTAKRLGRVAYCIARLARDGQSRLRRPAAAMADCEGDLVWLEQRFGGDVEMAWPSTTDPAWLGGSYAPLG